MEEDRGSKCKGRKALQAGAGELGHWCVKLVRFNIITAIWDFGRGASSLHHGRLGCGSAAHMYVMCIYCLWV
jgi:hypothetical protein